MVCLRLTKTGRTNGGYWMKRLFIAIGGACLLFSGPSGAQTAASASRAAAYSGPASFDCAKAGAAVERMICASADVAQLDGALAALYKQTLATAGNTDAIKSRQRDWLKTVRNACATPDCLAAAYRQRIGELQKQGTAAPDAASPFPATYVGGFTGRERLEFTSDGRVIEDGEDTGTYKTDSSAYGTGAKYPIIITPRSKGEISHCKVQPDLKKLICNFGGTIDADYDREGAVPAVSLPAAKKCDDEQLYLDVMEAARRAQPSLYLRGVLGLSLQPNGMCRITLFYLNNGKEVDLTATYDLATRPVKLVFLPVH